MSLGRAGFGLVPTINSREDRLGIQIYISHEESKSYFSQLKEQSKAIEAKLGFLLDWQELPESHACRIVIYKNEAQLSDESAWPGNFEWLTNTCLKMDQVFRPLVRNLA